jgi:hypothetical protein
VVKQLIIIAPGCNNNPNCGTCQAHSQSLLIHTLPRLFYLAFSQDNIPNAPTKGRTPLEILNEVLISHLSAVEQRRGISFQVIAEIISLGDKKLNSRVSQAIARYTGCLKELLVEGVRSGEIREGLDLDTVTNALFGIIQGLVNIWALRNYSFDPKEKYVGLWNIFREAIIKR